MRSDIHIKKFKIISIKRAKVINKNCNIFQKL